ncbi:hypothetical protein BSBH6_01194 [Bacillus subtilis]|nr:hypothetical protein BSBH6_01194 [Bacillus subtilis]RPK18498.1 hypothetical protein BH5_01191 [Bacillus subtilis]
MSHTLLFSQNVHIKEKEGLSKDVLKTAGGQDAQSLAAFHSKIKKTGSI